MIVCSVFDDREGCQLLDSIVYGGRGKKVRSWKRRRQFMLLSEDVCECRASVTDNSAAQIGLMHFGVQRISFTNTPRPVTRFDSACFDCTVTNCAAWRCWFGLALLLSLICASQIFNGIRPVSCFPQECFLQD